ncbi:MAG: hypothetical protein JSS02_08805 [Planctomycetes bacterium]|nr:hypothetical protein [Planctomycetota bacterium]
MGWKWRGLGLALGVLATLAVSYWLRSRGQSAPVSVEPTALPPLAASPYRNVDLQTAYVGSEACRSCHAAQFESYLQTMHSRSLNDIDLAAEPADASLQVPGTRISYQVYRQDGQLRHAQLLRGSDGAPVVLADYPVRYVVGSGNLSRTYLCELDGFLVESPITWYSATKKWALSPGYEKQDSGFARPVYFECIYCHAGEVRPAAETDGLMTIHDQAISCERCHGPGELHVQKRTDAGPSADGANANEIDDTIVNPAKLDRERSIAVCSQCHLNGEASAELSGRFIHHFRPGQLWSEYRTDYTQAAPADSMTVVGHVEQMRASRCFTASETMTCTTCHDPHSRTPVAERPAKYREICLSCHQPTACGLNETERLVKSPQDLCATCHMPKTPSDIPHVAATHHRVGIHPEHPPDADRPAEFAELEPLSDVSAWPKSEQLRNLGLAYLQASLKQETPRIAQEMRQEALRTLRVARQLLPDDGDLLAGLAYCLSVEDSRQTIELAEQALLKSQLTPRGRIRALFLLSDAHCRLQQPGEAVPHLEQLVKLRRQGGDWFRLAVCRELLGEHTGALAAAQRAVSIMPTDPKFHDLVVEIAEKQGATQVAAEHRRLAQQLRIFQGTD